MNQRRLSRLIELYLATWRLSHMLVNEDGPMDILGRFRQMVGVRYNTFSIAYGTNPFAQLLTCVWCLSVWVASGLTFLNRLEHGRLIIRALAASGGAILIDEVIARLNDRP